MIDMNKINKKQLFHGKVVSDKMDKTIVVEHQRTYKNLDINKVIKVTKKYKVHDEKELASVGDMVEFYEGRPLSKTKYMYLVRVMNIDTKNSAVGK